MSIYVKEFFYIISEIYFHQETLNSVIVLLFSFNKFLVADQDKQCVSLSDLNVGWNERNAFFQTCYAVWILSPLVFFPLYWSCKCASALLRVHLLTFHMWGLKTYHRPNLPRISQSKHCGYQHPVSECWFESHLRHYPSSCLLMCMAKNMMTQMLGPLPLTWETRGQSSGLSAWPSSGSSEHLRSKLVNEQSCSQSLSLPLCLSS